MTESLNGRTYYTAAQLAKLYGVSKTTVLKRAREMESTGRYTYCVRRLRGTEISREDFDDFICRGGKR